MDGGSGTVGRDEELATVREFLDHVERFPAALLIEGEAGIGKTTIWRAALEAAAERDCRVLACAPAASEAQLSFGALGDLTSGILDDTLPSLPGPQRRALGVALLLDEPEGPPADLRAVAVGFLSILKGLAARSPVVVAVDDVQWLDSATAAVLAHTIRRLRDDRVALVVSRRVDTHAPVPLGMDRALAPDRFERLELKPLSFGALHHLLNKRLGRAFTRPTMRRLHEVSGGNPFFALELARAEAEAEATLEPRQTRELPRTVQEVVGRRLSALPSDTRQALVVAAAAAEPTRTLVEAVIGPSQEHLARAVDAEVVILADERVRFAHPLLASGVYAQAPARERREIHRQLAELAPTVEERARHIALSRDPPDPDAARLLEEGATQAAARGAVAAGAELADLSVQFTPAGDVDDGRRRRFLAADYHFTAGDAARARELLEALIADLPAGPIRARALIQLSWAKDDWNVVGEMTEQALREGGDDVVLLSRAHHWLVFFEMVQGRVPAAIAHGHEAVRLARLSGNPLVLVHALTASILIRTTGGVDVSQEDISEALALEESLAGIALYYSPTLVVGLRLMYKDRLREARSALALALRASSEGGDEIMQGGIFLHTAELECRAGNLEIAAARAEDGYQITQQVGLYDRQAPLLYVKALVDAHRGRPETARRWAEEGIDISYRASHLIWATWSETVLGILELSLGQAAEAAARLERVAETFVPMGYGEPSVIPVLPNAIEALVAVGKLDEAEALLSTLEQQSRTVRTPFALSTAARGRGLLAGARGDYETALASFDEAMRHHERMPGPFERGRTLLALGAVQRRVKHRGAARESLERAIATFEGMGSPLWAERAREELSRIGGRAPSGKLTGTERQVAELVAAGLSNKDVAARLFITVRAVEANLSRIYAKLGVKSRTELTRRMAEERSPVPA